MKKYSISILYVWFSWKLTTPFLEAEPKVKKASPGSILFQLSISSNPSIFNLHWPIPKISNSWSPVIFGVYSQENLVEILRPSSCIITSLAKPSNTQNLSPISLSLRIKFLSKFSPSKYSTKNPLLSLIKLSSILGKYLCVWQPFAYEISVLQSTLFWIASKGWTW